MIQSFLSNKLPEIKKLLKAHKVTKAYIFGSACTESFNDKSDIDLLIMRIKS
ncbi:MAG: nucleotidyltransferase domain-containing protein [Bacteroidales bacterium]|nr:nucleotidyltransferase domain-containing protein [Bacteroidales bacterium]